MTPPFPSRFYSSGQMARSTEIIHAIKPSDGSSTSFFPGKGTCTPGFLIARASSGAEIARSVGASVQPIHVDYRGFARTYLTQVGPQVGSRLGTLSQPSARPR